MRTITKNCPKANLVQAVDTSVEGIEPQPVLLRISLPPMRIQAPPVSSSAQAQGVAHTIKALPNVDISKYGVFAGDMDPSMIETIKSCQDPYKGLVAIGGTNLDQATYDRSRRSCRAWNIRRSPTTCWNRSSVNQRLRLPAGRYQRHKGLRPAPDPGKYLSEQPGYSVKEKAAADGVEGLSMALKKVVQPRSTANTRTAFRWVSRA